MHDCPYAALQLPRTATAREIRRAFRTLVLQCHPDRQPGNEDGGARFRRVHAAYALLSDPVRKREYDHSALGLLHRLQQASPGTANQNAPRAPRLGTLRITPAEAKLGQVMRLQLPGGSAQLVIPAGTQPGDVLRIASDGPGRATQTWLLRVRVQAPPAA